MMKLFCTTILSLLMLTTVSAGDKKENQLKEQLAAMKHQYDSISSLLNARTTTIDALQQRCDSLQLALNALSMFRQEFVKKQLIDNGPDLTAAFSKASFQQMVTYELRLKTFEGDPDVDKLLQQVETYKQYLARYDTYLGLLDMPFTRDGVADAYKTITGSLKLQEGKDITSEQYAEFYQIAVYLSRYYQGCKDFQMLIKNIDAKLKSYKGNSDEASRTFCIGLAKQQIEAMQSDIDKRIMNIPYLSKRFLLYKNNLESNPLKLTPEVERAINEINSLILD